MLPKCKWKVQKGEINVVKGLGVSFVIFQFALTAVPEVGPREIRGYSSWTTATGVITALLFFFFSSFFCFRTSRSKGAGYVTGCSANYFIAPACWALLQWKHLKFCPWSRELDHTTVLLWNFFFFFFFVEDHLRSEKMPWAGSKHVTWAVCCWCLSTKLTLPAPMGVPGAETADCQLPGTVLSRLLCQINIDLNWRSLELCLSLPFKHVLLFSFLQSK